MHLVFIANKRAALEEHVLLAPPGTKNFSRNGRHEYMFRVTAEGTLKLKRSSELLIMISMPRARPAIAKTTRSYTIPI